MKHLTATRFASVISGLVLLLLASGLLGLVLGPSTLSLGEVHGRQDNNDLRRCGRGRRRRYR